MKREPNKLVEQNHHCNDFELRDNQFVKIIAAVISFSGLIWVYFKTDIIVVCTQPCNVYPQYTTTIQCVTNSQVDRDPYRLSSMFKFRGFTALKQNYATCWQRLIQAFIKGDNRD